MQDRVHKLWASFAISSCLFMQAAVGGESITNPEPVGGTDLNQALLPPTGLYGGLAGLPPFANGGDHFTDEYGHILPPSSDIHIRVFVAAAGLLYVYPWEVLGGRLATSIQASFETLTIAPNAVHGASVSRSGLGDIYADAFFWSRYVGLVGATPGASEHIPYGLTVAGGFAFKAPTGVYVDTNSFNVGSNLWILAPNAAVTYNTGPNWSLGDSTQLSARLYMSFPMKNAATNYQSGNVLDVDWSISQILGNWQVGAAGYYNYQYTNDVGTNLITGLKCPSGACIDGHRNGEFAIGPVLEYNFPDTGVSIKVKYTHDLWAKNNTVTNIALFTIGMKLQ
jgi:hypothetical protein